MSLADMMSRLVSLASWLGQLLLLLNLPLVLAGMVHVPWHVVILLVFAPTLMALVFSPGIWWIGLRMNLSGSDVQILQMYS